MITVPATPLLPGCDGVFLPPLPPLPAVVYGVSLGFPPPPYAYITAVPVIEFDKPAVGTAEPGEPAPLAPPPGAP